MKIHVVSFQVPYPANYGGAIDVYYKLKALREIGFSIILHTYIYGGATEQAHLREICKEVHYYRRETGFCHQLHLEPYIAASRQNKQLLENLCMDDAPILFEGLHTCHFLSHPQLRNRKKWVRMHNIEHDYYRLLAMQNRWSWRSLFYIAEAWKLKCFERILTHATGILAISEADETSLNTRFPHNKVVLLPCFYDNVMVSPKGSTQPYCLYHGNLSVEENLQVANFIQDHLAVQMPDTQFVLAGRNPSFTSRHSNVILIPNPSDEKLDTLLTNARVNFLFTFQPTGIKLKLLNALSKSRGHVIANSEMLHGHDLGELCVQACSGKELVAQLYNLLQQPPTAEAISNRQGILQQKQRGRVSRLSLLLRY